MRLADFTDIARHCREHGLGYAEFRRLDLVIDLQWPDDVVEQWIYDHSGNGAFLRDYAGLDLEIIRWEVEALAVEEFLDMPTGPSDADDIEYFAANPDHWVDVRRNGVHQGVRLAWEVHGTWKRWPIIIDQNLLNSTEVGLQLVEGRNRVGILRGRHRQAQQVAERHLAWVGRLRK